MKKTAITIIIFVSFLLIASDPAFSAKRVHKVKSGSKVTATAKKHHTSTHKPKTLSKRSTTKLKQKQKSIARRNVPAPRAERRPESLATSTENDGEFIEYRLRTGDTLDKIAMKFSVDKEDILASNNISDRKLPAILLIPRTVEDDEGEPVVTLSTKNIKPWRSNDEKYMLVKAAKSFMGAPYLYGGESVRGLDCSAFVRKIYDIFDVQLPRTAREQFRVGNPVSRGDLAVGDLVFFRTKKDVNYPTHVGIYIGNGNFIHSSSGRSKYGVAIDALSSSFYHRTFLGATRVKKSPDDSAEESSKPSDKASINS